MTRPTYRVWNGKEMLYEEQIYLLENKEQDMINWIIMQNIGKQDINGKEIFEDDIVFTKDGAIKLVIRDILEMNEEYLDGCDVIGNLHENANYLY